MSSVSRTLSNRWAYSKHVSYLARVFSPSLLCNALNVTNRSQSRAAHWYILVGEETMEGKICVSPVGKSLRWRFRDCDSKIMFMSLGTKCTKLPCWARSLSKRISSFLIQQIPPFVMLEIHSFSNHLCWLWIMHEMRALVRRQATIFQMYIVAVGRCDGDVMNNYGGIDWRCCSSSYRLTVCNRHQSNFRLWIW